MPWLQQLMIRSVLWRGCGSKIGQEPRKPLVLDTDAGKSHGSSTSQGMVGICGNVMRNPNLPVSEVAYRKQIDLLFEYMLVQHLCFSVPLKMSISANKYKKL
jgi:hypothetical protein